MRIARIASALTLVVLAATGALAASVFSAKMATVPPQPYAGEDFELAFSVTATPGCEIGIAEISGVPAGETLMVGQFSLRDSTPLRTTNGEERIVHTFTAPARALSPFSFSPNAIARLKITERTSQGFFTSWNTSMRTLRVIWNDLTIRELPTEGRPADFSGAIGRYELRLEATPTEVMPNDIVKLNLELKGHGYLGDAVPAMPRLDERLFKSYPPAVTRNEDGTLSVAQSVIPLSTNAVTIGGATFSFFDAGRGAYTNYVTHPIALTFVSERRSEAPAVREVVVDTGAKPRPEAGVDVARYINLVRGGKSFPLENDAVLRIAPGNSARKIMSLPAGTQVTPLETARGFLRVSALDRSGWISVSD